MSYLSMAERHDEASDSIITPVVLLQCVMLGFITTFYRKDSRCALLKGKLAEIWWCRTPVCMENHYFWLKQGEILDNFQRFHGDFFGNLSPLVSLRQIRMKWPDPHRSGPLGDGKASEVTWQSRGEMSPWAHYLPSLQTPTTYFSALIIRARRQWCFCAAERDSLS